MIKNVDMIKVKARAQIKDLLDRMGCYEYTAEGIDKWLTAWEYGCEKQITEIAEKSPYYDGDCKIVFPAEYPRDIDGYQINNFIDWLGNYAKRNKKEVFIDGFSYKEAVNINDFLKNLAFVFEIARCSIKNKMPDDILDKYSCIDYIIKSEWAKKVLNAKSEFESISKYIIIGNKAVDINEFSELNLIPSKLTDFLYSMNYSSCQFLTEDAAKRLKELFPECRFSKGQKLSRAVGLIGRKYNLTADPEWEKEFAKFADAVNPLTVKKWTVISWHPMDYLTFCFGDSWSSCCTIDKNNVRGVRIGKSRSSITNYVDEFYEFNGDHSAAALSYMFDKSSFIYYTVSDKYEGKLYEEQDKNTRIVFSLSEDMTTLLQSRLYPQCNDDNPNDTPYKIPREIVQKIICDALEVPNLWTVKKGHRVCKKYGISIGVHYPDYKDERNKQCNISYRGDTPSEILIGSNAICPKCGRAHDHVYSLNCRHCDPCY